MATDTVFPVNSRDVAIVTCSTGYVLSGDYNITCQEGTEFTYTDVPTCSVLGKLFNKILTSLDVCTSKNQKLNPKPQGVRCPIKP